MTSLLKNIIISGPNHHDVDPYFNHYPIIISTTVSNKYYQYSDGVKVRMTAGFSKKITAALRMTEKCPELE